MTDSKISFSVFLPVKNGGDYLSVCVESILNQTYCNFELIILENQSDDGTENYCVSLASQNAKVKVIPTEKSLSIEKNWARVLQQKKNDYMTIIGHDDILAPNFLAEIKRIIDKNPEANLYQTHFNLIDEKGELIRQCIPIPKSETAAEFLSSRLSDNRDSFGTGYVVSSDLYDKVGGIPISKDLLYCDDALWLKSIESGFKVTSPKVCFFYRFHSVSKSGSPDQRKLFYALKWYLVFLKKLAKENLDIDSAIRLNIKSFVIKRCRTYFSYVVQHNLFWGKSAKNEVNEINKMMTQLNSFGIEWDGEIFSKKLRRFSLKSKIIDRFRCIMRF
jgi:glycosyltransferase involved in cell wall biosynthesis